MKLSDMASGVLSRVVWAIVIGFLGARCGGSSHEFPPRSISYNVCFSAGGIDRLVIAKANTRLGICTRMTLVRPATSSALDISLPYGWGVESASVSNNPADCHTGKGSRHLGLSGWHRPAFGDCRCQSLFPELSRWRPQPTAGMGPPLFHSWHQSLAGFRLRPIGEWRLPTPAPNCEAT